MTDPKLLSIGVAQATVGTLGRGQADAGSVFAYAPQAFSAWARRCWLPGLPV
jgi:hypothetical protein